MPGAFLADHVAAGSALIQACEKAGATVPRYGFPATLPAYLLLLMMHC